MTFALYSCRTSCPDGSVTTQATSTMSQDEGLSPPVSQSKKKRLQSFIAGRGGIDGPLRKLIPETEVDLASTRARGNRSSRLFSWPHVQPSPPQVTSKSRRTSHGPG